MTPGTVNAALIVSAYWLHEPLWFCVPVGLPPRPLGREEKGSDKESGSWESEPGSCVIIFPCGPQLPHL